MPQRIKVKKSLVEGKIPDVADLEVVELALNIAVKKLYSKDVAGDVFEINPTAPAGYWENDTSASDIKNLDAITKVSVNGAVHTNATLDLNTGNFAIRLFPSSDQTGAYTAIGATGSYGTFSIGTAQVGVSNPWTSLVRFMVDANGKTIVGNDNGFGPPVAAADAELTVKGGVNSEFGTNAAQLGNIAPLNDWSCYPARPTTFYVAPPPSPTPTPEPVDPDFGVDVPTLSGGLSSAGTMDIIDLGDA